MKNKYFLIKVAGIAFLILLVIIYFLLYFVPTIKEISFQKRQLKDMNLKITDFVKMENIFSFSNSRERNLFQQSQDELKKKIPEIRHREDYIALFTRVSDYIQQLAKKDSIFNLVFTSDSQEMQVETGSLATSKKNLDDLLSFSAQRLDSIKKQQLLEDKSSGTAIGGLAELVKGLKYHTVWITFTGELPSAMNFVNHIPRCDYFLSEDKILIASGTGLPYYIVSLKIFYVDLRGETDTGKTP
jgi:hypothetical protein